MIEFKPGVHYAGIYFVPAPSAEHRRQHPAVPEMDVMGCLFRNLEGEDTSWHFVYRFRYYSATPSGPFDGADTKRWYDASGGKDEGMAHEAATTVMSLCALRNGVELDYVPIHGDYLKALAAIQTRPWCHAKLATEGDPTHEQR